MTKGMGSYGVKDDRSPPRCQAHFTPGPWTRSPQSTNGWDAQSAHVGTVRDAEWNLALVFADGYIGRETAEANARLIAAAPTMYRALSDLLDALIGVQGPQIDAARAALSLAVNGGTDNGGTQNTSQSEGA